jgi:hypothetical protein
VGFDIRIGCLRNFGLELDELAQNINPHHYIEANTKLPPWDHGYLNRVWPLHEQIVERTIEQNKKIYGPGAVLYRSRQALDDTATLYADNDRGNADGFERLTEADESIGAVTRPRHETLPARQRNVYGLPTYQEHFPFVTDRDPLSGDAGRMLDARPTPPAENPDTDDPVGSIKSAVDWFSPTHLINTGIFKLFHVDLVGEISDVFGGDWQAWWRSADVWRRVGETQALVAHEVWRGNARLDADWHGNAADAAYAYFHQLAFAIKDLKPVYDKLWNVYRITGMHVDKASGIIADLLKELSDQAIIAFLSTTPAGGALVGGHVVVKIRNILDRIQKTTMIYDGLVGAAAGVVGEVMSWMTDIEKKLPEPYAMPASYRKLKD